MPLLYADAQDVAGMLVATGRAVPFGAWSGKWAEQAEEARIANLPHNRI